MWSFRSTTVVQVVVAILFLHPGGARAQCPPAGAECPLVRLLPCDLKPGDSLRGYAAEGNLVIAGAPGADDASPSNNDCNSGALYVFRRDGTDWVKESRLTAFDKACEEVFGGPAAISGDWLSVGASRTTGPTSGSAYLFFRDTGGVWTQAQKLTSLVGGSDKFGGSMAIDDNLAVVGASGYGSFDAAGTVYAYHREDPQNTPTNPADDVWVPEMPELHASDPGAGDWFGYAVSISQNWLAVGELRDGHEPSIGSVHMFERVLGTWVWRQQLKAWDGQSSQREFGASVSLDGDRLVIGAPLHGDCNGCGAAYVFHLSAGTGTWDQEQRLVACDAAPGDEFGTDAAIDGDRIVVGSHQDDNTVVDAGSAYLFEWNGTQWVDYTKLTKPDPPGPAFQDGFGRFVQITGSLVIVGPPYDDQCGLESGSVYVFDVSGAVCNLDTPILCPDCQPNGFPDACEINACTSDPACADCNANGIPDECDISDGTSLDCNSNGTPDECEVPPLCPTCPDCNANNIPDDCDLDCADNGVPDDCECLAAAAALAEPGGLSKNRYLSFVPGNDCVRTAIRVTFTDLPPPFEAFEGEHRWVGPPRFVTEQAASNGQGPPPVFAHATLRQTPECGPHFDDWGPWGLLHVSGAAVVPNAVYTVQLVHEGCGIIGDGNYSPPLLVATSEKWSDVASPFGGALQPNFLDISAVVDKFRDLPVAPIKARADLFGSEPDNLVNFLDISAAVDAFRGSSYPFAGPPPCP